MTGIIPIAARRYGLKFASPVFNLVIAPILS
jgi:hypothetical protein